MPIEPPADVPAPGASGRQPIDYMLMTSRQQLMELSAQADLKASIVITTSSLVLTLAISRINSNDYRAAMVVLAAGVLGALVFAIVAVIPKFRIGRILNSRPDGVNPLFFSHIAHTSEADYLAEMMDLIRDDETIYRAILSDIHAQSRYLIHAKYRWLRVSYLLLLAGFVGAVVVGIPTGF